MVCRLSASEAAGVKRAVGTAYETASLMPLQLMALGSNNFEMVVGTDNLAMRLGTQVCAATDAGQLPVSKEAPAATH